MAVEDTAALPVRRRRLHFNNFEEVLDEIESLHARPHRQLGNWPLPIITGHLALGMHGSIDGGTFPVPWHFKLLGPWFIKPRLLKRFPSGFQLPRVAREKLIPKEISYADAIENLRGAIERLKAETKRGSHPVLGKLTIDEWNRFHLRHCEMHLGFLVPH